MTFIGKPANANQNTFWNGTNWTDGYIVNVNVSNSAAIAVSKLASGTSAQILLNNSTPTPTWTTISGDISITSSGVTTVAAIDGYTLPTPAAPAIGVLHTTGTALSWSLVSLTADVTGVLPTVNQANQSLGGDLSGTTASATLAKIDGYTLPSPGSPNSGFLYSSGTALTWNQLSGDVSNSVGAITVTKIQGNAVASGANGASQDGYVLTWVNASSQYQVKPAAGGGITALTGDVTASGSGSVAATVAAISGSTPIVITPNEFKWISTAAPLLDQTALASTSSATGSVGQTFAITAQAGQAATGASHNGGAGGVLNITSGTGGSSGSNTGGAGGALNLISGAGGTGSSLGGVSGAVSLQSGVAGAANFSGALNISTGAATSAGSASGNLTINTGNQSGGSSGSSGNITMSTGTTVSGSGGSGNITISTPTGGSGFSSGSITLQTAAPTGGGSIGQIVVNNQGTTTGTAGIVIKTAGPNIQLFNSVSGLSVTLSSTNYTIQPAIVATANSTSLISASFITNQAQFTKSVQYNSSIKTSAYTVALGDFIIFANSTSAAFTVTLPSTSSTGDTYRIKDYAGTALTNNITVAGNGKNIDGSANYVLNLNFACIELTYNGTQWNVVGSYNGTVI